MGNIRIRTYAGRIQKVRGLRGISAGFGEPLRNIPELRKAAAKAIFTMLVDGTKTMKTTTVQAASARQVPSPWRDVQRDWDGWSPWERRAVSALGFASTTSAFVWFALSLNLIS